MNSETASTSTGIAAPQITAGSTIPRHACAACHQVFPETMAVCVGQRWLCMLCKERALEDETRPKRRYSMSTWAPDVEKWKLILTLIAVFGGLGVRMFLWNRVNPGIRDDERPEPWVTKGSEDWPQLVAGAKAEFKDEALAAAGNIFFVQKNDAEIVSVTVAANAWSELAIKEAPLQTVPPKKSQAGGQKPSHRADSWTKVTSSPCRA